MSRQGETWTTADHKGRGSSTRVQSYYDHHGHKPCSLHVDCDHAGLVDHRLVPSTSLDYRAGLGVLTPSFMHPLNAP